MRNPHTLADNNNRATSSGVISNHLDRLADDFDRKAKSKRLKVSQRRLFHNAAMELRSIAVEVEATERELHVQRRSRLVAQALGVLALLIQTLKQFGVSSIIKTTRND